MNNTPNLPRRITNRRRARVFNTQDEENIRNLLLQRGVTFNLPGSLELINVVPNTTGNNCSICFDDEEQVGNIDTMCGHTFCRPCLVRWKNSGRQNSHTCPYCRSEGTFFGKISKRRKSRSKRRKSRRKSRSKRRKSRSKRRKSRSKSRSKR
jgi:hypothetical protein